MFQFIVLMWTLCVGEVVHCKEILQADHVRYDAGFNNNMLNFGYGVNFKFNGKIHNNLDRVWIVKRFNLPQELNHHFKGINFGLNCTYDNMTLQVKSNLGQMGKLNFIKEICRQTRSMLKTM